MKRPGKWIQGIDPGESVADAARAVLKVRLCAAARLLALAQSRFDEDSEHVHQLRVATRRATAALTVFRPWLRERTWAKLWKRLRWIRRAAREAREWDVFADSLGEDRSRLPEQSKPAVELLLRYAAAKRAEAQQAVAACRSLRAKLRRAARLRRALTEPGGHAGGESRIKTATAFPSFIDAGRAKLPPLVRELRAAADADLDDIANLHRLRLAAKRLRYALEIFEPCFGGAIRRELYPRVEELQELLGRINDSHQVIARMDEVLGELHRLRGPNGPSAAVLRRGLVTLRELHRRCEEQHRQAFVARRRELLGAKFFEMCDSLSHLPGAGQRRHRAKPRTTGRVELAQRSAPRRRP